MKPLFHGTQDAVVIGGGMYGAAIAVYLVETRKLKRVLLVEKEACLLSRASLNNQARVHSGYHYPRSFTTAYRSRVNYPKFVRDWPDAVYKTFAKLYAIPTRNSKVTSRQFERFCNQIGAKIERANPRYRDLFSERLIEDVFLVEEYAFDATILAEWAKMALAKNGIHIELQSRATGIAKSQSGHLDVSLTSHGSEEVNVNSRMVFNCTYSGLNQLRGEFPGIRSRLKHEITEMAILEVPDPLKNLGITVMDGPFFSLMPFPSRGLHTLSHVRYTPHASWNDKHGIDPYVKLRDYERQSRIDRMIRDASRYLPSISNSKYIDSLYEVKTVLVKSEGDDGRPILFEKHADLPGCFSILGGKVDNIYDTYEKMDSELFDF